jgi:hypothetical protein
MPLLAILDSITVLSEIKAVELYIPPIAKFPESAAEKSVSSTSDVSALASFAPLTKIVNPFAPLAPIRVVCNKGEPVAKSPPVSRFSASPPPSLNCVLILPVG